MNVIAKILVHNETLLNCNILYNYYFFQTGVKAPQVQEKDRKTKYQSKQDWKERKTKYEKFYPLVNRKTKLCKIIIYLVSFSINMAPRIMTTSANEIFDSCH